MQYDAKILTTPFDLYPEIDGSLRVLSMKAPFIMSRFSFRKIPLEIG